LLNLPHATRRPYRAIPARHGLVQSMSRKGNCLDCESIGAARGA
jgi:hypothetical protein